MLNRRRFIGTTGSAFAALLASGCSLRADNDFPTVPAYGALMKDPEGVLDLPEGFEYRILSRLDEPMSDGGTVPDNADGMGCIALDDDTLVLVRNHELMPGDGAGGTIAKGYGSRFDEVCPGGTTNLVLDANTLAVKDQFRSLGGTIRNCSGGVTPWGSWLTCEEAPVGPNHEKYGDGLSAYHGWVFEVPAAATGLIDPVPLKAMGRFNHEAACVDPTSGIVYMTEDRDEGVLYRFLPTEPGNLAAGGRLQAMRVAGLADTRNWDSPVMPVDQRFAIDWIDLDDVEAPDDDLRMRAAAAGASLIARGEGIHMGDDELYFCSTSGGAAGLGQIFRLIPGRDGAEDQLALFFESVSKRQFNYGDNLAVAPNGHLIICEDQYTPIVDNHLRGITPEGKAYPLGRLRKQTELAGACFSPNGEWMFVNAYSPTMTFAIRGPWHSFRNA